MSNYSFHLDQIQEYWLNLRAGDTVKLSGTIYTARDAAHKRMADAILSGAPMPLDIRGKVIYYTGPTPAKLGYPIGSVGPTTSSRMDKYTPSLLDLGLKGMIGKGDRGSEVIDAIIRNNAIYFAATGGAGALLASCVKCTSAIAYNDLGAESIFQLDVMDFPLVVAIDSFGNNLYRTR